MRRPAPLVVKWRTPRSPSPSSPTLPKKIRAPAARPCLKQRVRNGQHAHHPCAVVTACSQAIRPEPDNGVAKHRVDVTERTITSGAFCRQVGSGTLRKHSRRIGSTLLSPASTKRRQATPPHLFPKEAQESPPSPPAGHDLLRIAVQPCKGRVNGPLGASVVTREKEELREKSAIRLTSG